MDIHMQELLQATIDEGGSDLHFRAYMPPELRVHGELLPLSDESLSEEGFDSMRAAAAHYVGEHDFTAFMCTDSDMENCVRIVHDAYVEMVGDEVVFSVCANGFLYNMVRIMVGTLFEIGVGRLDISSIDRALLGRERLLAGMTAPPEGLYLHRVFYPEHIQKQLFCD